MLLKWPVSVHSLVTESSVLKFASLWSRDGSYLLFSACIEQSNKNSKVIAILLISQLLQSLFTQYMKAYKLKRCSFSKRQYWWLSQKNPLFCNCNLSGKEFVTWCRINFLVVGIAFRTYAKKFAAFCCINACSYNIILLG